MEGMIGGVPPSALRAAAAEASRDWAPMHQYRSVTVTEDRAMTDGDDVVTYRISGEHSTGDSVTFAEGLTSEVAFFVLEGMAAHARRIRNTLTRPCLWRYVFGEEDLSHQLRHHEAMVTLTFRNRFAAMTARATLNRAICATED